jgi:hypothetical protein
LLGTEERKESVSGGNGREEKGKKTYGRASRLAESELEDVYTHASVEDERDPDTADDGGTAAG